jgi:hypothetical protein
MVGSVGGGVGMAMVTTAKFALCVPVLVIEKT